MNPTVWLVIFIIALSAECVTMSLRSASFAPGALVSAVMCFAGLPVWAQIVAFLVVTAIMMVLVRPRLAREFNRQKRQHRLDQLIGRDAIVICEIENAHGVGVVNIGGREYRARSNRPNAIISEGTLVKVVEMRGDVAIVDDNKRHATGRIDFPFKGDFD